MKTNNKLIEMSLEGVRIELPSQRPIILLKEKEGYIYLPIWVGAFEASAIALELSNIKTPRPMTHDLIINILKNLNIKVDTIEVSDIKDNTFYAVLNLKNINRKVIRVDSRPSDAIAIAVREKCKIFSSYHVLTQAGIKIQSIDDEVQKFKNFLEHVNPEDFNQI
ncbi:MAG: bifunctional nuclease family protein [Actinobacteria bacterium]|nr:bifunctional nuclease family protein [Actinomycetota bacterium]MBM3712241.1 bifunctional nuclease family protein [Actinomycetota bacterium]